MTITTPNTFKRSTERQVGDPNELIAVEEDRRRNRALLEFEAIGCSAAAASVLVTKPSWEERYDRMLAEDTSSFDVDGQVR